jgi:histidyl-tRNA synthetase
VYQIPRGTRDFTSKEMQKRRYVEEQIKKTFQNFGYREIQTPTFENLELFTAKSGETIIEELYSFKDKGDRDLALRPELTAPVIRFYVEKLQMEPKPLKLFYFGNCFRYDRPQKGRYREFRQAGCEIIGADNPEAYAELIALAYKILKNVGLKNIKLNIGNLDILSSIFKKLNLSDDNIKYITPLIDKSLFDELFDALIEFNVAKKDVEKLLDLLQTTDIKKILKYTEGEKSHKEELSKMQDILTFLEDSFGIKNYQVKLSIVRGLDYYKGIVFEIEAPKLGAEKQLCGGGAYELVNLFGGRETPTAGFAIGFDRTILALELENYNFPSFRLDAYVIPFNEDMLNKSLQITQSLREKGYKIDIDLLRRGIGKSLKYASSAGSNKAIIVGPDELKKESVTVKDMKTGKQQLIKIQKLSDFLEK